MGAARLRAALLDRAAAQWASLGVALEGPREQAVVDLEALIGLTAAVGGDDARVWQGGVAWCGRMGRYVNGARLKRVLAEAGVASDAFSVFAAAARRAGAPPWAVDAPPEGWVPIETARDDLLVVRRARGAARTLWTLRAAFGVNARADIVATLLARPGLSLTTLEVAHLTRFGKRNVAVALDDLVLSGVVERRPTGSMGRFRLRDEAGLLRWLDLPASIEYPDWVARLSVGRGVLAFLDLPAQSERVRAIEARQVVVGLRTAIERSGDAGPDMRVTGPAFVEAFDAWVTALAGRWEVA